MKKLTCCILVLLLCLGSLFAAAEAPLVDEFFRCQIGRISFVLPGFPNVFHEPDLPARELGDTYCAWQNKLQLNGFGPMGGEFQVHIADLSPSLEWMREDRPGEEDAQYRYNALMNMVSFYLAIHKGNVTDDVSVRRVPTEDDFIAEITFGYTYPDTPGVEYRGRAFLDGTVGIVMMVQADAANLAALEDMHIVTTEEAAAFGQADPHTVTAGRMQITFPQKPQATLDTGYWFYEYFTPDFGYIALEHMQSDLRYMLTDDMDEDTMLATLAEMTGESYQQQGVITEYEVRRLGDGMYAFDAIQTDTRYPDEYGPVHTRFLAVFTMDGVYTIAAADTEMGRAFFDTLVILDAAP